MGQCDECPHKPLEGEKKVPEEGAIQVGNTSISGFRTYSIILLVMVVYCYLALKNGELGPMQELAFMICGYLFGAKVVGKR